MNIIICKNYNEVSKEAAEIIADAVKTNRNCTLGLATGSTPVGMYKILTEKYNSGELDFSEVVTFNLDEYFPIRKTNHQSYDYFMKENLFSHINIADSNTHIPNGEAPDGEKECEEYEKKLNEHSIDIQVLGLGVNGHIGFNEPSDCLISKTHLTDLTESTIEANSRFFSCAEEVPAKALTMGIGSIMRAKKILLLVSGKNKHNALSSLLNGIITTQIPVTVLNLHSDVTLICDEEAYYGNAL